jgi:hypothetical protein
MTYADSVSSLSYLTIVTGHFPLLLACHWVAFVYMVRESTGSDTMWLRAKCDSAVNVTGVAVWWGIVVRRCFGMLTGDFQCCRFWLVFTCLLSEHIRTWHWSQPKFLPLFKSEFLQRQKLALTVCLRHHCCHLFCRLQFGHFLRLLKADGGVSVQDNLRMVISLLMKCLQSTHEV